MVVITCGLQSFFLIMPSVLTHLPGGVGVNFCRLFSSIYIYCCFVEFLSCFVIYFLTLNIVCLQYFYFAMNTILRISDIPLYIL